MGVFRFLKRQLGIQKLEDRIVNLEDDTKAINDLEYNTLRQEILESIGREFNTINIALTAVVIIVGFNLTLKPPNLYIFISPIFILSLTTIQISQSHYGILQNALYIKLMKENSGKNWESWMSHFRSNPTKKPTIRSFLSFDFINNFFTLQYHVYFSLIGGFICLTFSLVFGWLTYSDSYRNFIKYFGDLKSVDPDYGVILFTIVFLAFLFFWVWFSFNIHQKLGGKKVGVFEREYENALKNWKSSEISNLIN